MGDSNLEEKYRSGADTNRSSTDRPGSTHRAHEEPNFEPNVYNGVPYPLPQALRAREEHRDLLDGTRIKTRDAILMAIAISGAMATVYVKVANIESSIVALEKETVQLDKRVSTISRESLLIKSESEDARDSIEDKVEDHLKNQSKLNVSVDRRLEFLEGKVSDLIFKNRRDG